MTKRDDDTLLVDLDDGSASDPVDAANEKATEVKRSEREVRRGESDDANQDAISALREQLASLQAERDAERAERIRAENAARDATTFANRARGEAAQTHYDLISTNLQTAKDRADQIKRDIRLAHESGDHERVADLQMEAAKLAARELQYADAKADIEDMARRQRAKAEAKRDNPPAPADTFDARIANLTPKSQAWLRSHPECVTDDVANAKVMWGHKEALRKGLQADTPEYFAHLEKHMGYGVKDEDGDEDAAEIAPKRSEPRGTMTAAPVSRDTPRSGSANPRQYRLTREEVEMAESLNMTPVKYAEWKLKAERDGRYAN